MENINENNICSLTDPHTLRENGTPFIPDTDAPLSKSETIAAVSELSIGTSLVQASPEAQKEATRYGFGEKSLFTRADRHFVDPPLNNQDIALFSFVPSIDAKPNKFGVYGFIKIRGTFPNVTESDQRAAELLQKHDSMHKIYHIKVGTPAPIVNPKMSAHFAASINEVDVKADAKNDISKFVKEAGEQDKKVMEELKERERQLREDVSKTPEEKASALTPLDKYIFARKRVSDNLFVFVEHRKKLHDVKNVILHAQKEADTIEEENPEVLTEYKDKYEQASKDSGIDKSNDQMAVMIRENFYNKPNLADIFSKDLV
jgi:hypothetical protein